MKNISQVIGLLLCLCYSLPSTLAQVTYKLELLPDQSTYQVSMIPDVSWTFPQNLTSSAQVTIKVPHGTGDYRFEVENLTSLVPETDWARNARINMPPEAPAYDYLSFGLLNLGTPAYEYTEGVEIPMFSFSNAGVSCVDSIRLIDNDTDPFSPPNSANANIGNSLAVLGAGLTNAYRGNLHTGSALCTPEVDCEDAVETAEALTLCEGESYQGVPIDSDTTVVANYVSFIGCDSIVTTQITVLETDTVEIYTIDCHSGINMPTRDTMTTLHTNSSGCDSVVIVYNETKPIFDTTLQVSLPEGALYEGMIYENDTTFTSFGLTSFGCDSTVTTQITILNNPTSFVDVSLCEGEIFQGQVFTMNTSLVDTIPLPSGVDSLVINNIIILPTYNEMISVLLPNGESYQNMTYDQDTILVENYTTTEGCDSTVTTQITILNNPTSFVDVPLCEGGTFQGQVFTMNTSLVDTIPLPSGVDSLVINNIIILPTYNEMISVLLPSGESYQNMTYDQDTILMESYTSAEGCDSLVTVQITILNNSTTFVNVPLCEGETFQGQVFTTNTSLVDTIPLPSGVDSLVINNIIILPTYNEMTSVMICEGEAYQNVVYTQDTTLMEMYTSAEGCDSTVMTEIIITDVYESFLEVEVCEGELFESVMYTQDTTFTATYTSQGGCDSLVYTQLVVHPLPNAMINGKSEICQGERSELSVASAATYAWSNGSTSQSIAVDSAGTYSVVVTSEQGCSSESSLEFLVHGIDVNAVVTPAGCQEFDTGAITFESTSTTSLLYSVTGGFGFSASPKFENLVPGTYNLVVKDGSGCLWEDQQVLSAPEELLIDLGDDIRIQLGDSVPINTLSNHANFSMIEWSPSESLSCSDCSNPMAQPMESTLFSVTVVDEQGCVASDDIRIFVNREPKVYIPNAFSPNGDGQNDMFMIYGGKSVEEVSMFRIFNRWGSLVFEKDSFSPEDPDYAWDGNFRGKKLQGGVFVYMAELELTDGSRVVMKGEINLLR